MLIVIVFCFLIAAELIVGLMTHTYLSRVLRLANGEEERRSAGWRMFIFASLAMISIAGSIVVFDAVIPQPMTVRWGTVVATAVLYASLVYVVQDSAKRQLRKLGLTLVAG